MTRTAGRWEWVIAWAAMVSAARAEVQNALDAAGPQAAHIGGLGQLFLWTCLGVFGVVMVFLWLALRRGGRAGESEIERHRRFTRVIAGGIAATAVILFVFLVASVSTSRALARLERPGVRTIWVDGRQWWWFVRYEDATPSNIVTTANEIHIPVDEPVKLRLTATDVIHSFWVPNLHGKRDLIPGHVTNLWLQADRPGEYRGQCAEFCGFQHAHMGLVVIAEPKAQFEAWLAAQRRPAREPLTADEKRGRAVFLTSTCLMCHAIRGTEANGRNGPDLTHLASRRTLAAATMPNTRGHLAGWILDPQSLKPGNHMPANPLPPDDLQALLDYLMTLQ